MSVHVSLPDEAIEQLAAAVLPLVLERLAERELAPASAWLNAAAAAEYLSVPRRRIYDLKSMGVLEPDGFDGRTPLWRRATLDATCGRSARDALPHRCPNASQSRMPGGLAASRPAA